MGLQAFCLLGLLTVLGCSADALPRTSDAAQSPSTQMSTYTSEWGIRLGIVRQYPEDRVLSSPSATVGGLVDVGELWPLDDADHEGEDLDPLALSAGTKVSYEAVVKPDCDNVDASPPIEFRIPATLPNGKQVVDVMSPSNPSAYAVAVNLWCRLGVAVQVGGGSLGEGNEPSRVAILVSNQSSNDIHVEVPALESHGASWRALAFTVPSGEQVTREVLGWDVRCDRTQERPWADGRLLIDDSPWDEPIADVWC
jgi:hypothetical protein